jgi:serine/threonine-protein kinase
VLFAALVMGRCGRRDDEKDAKARAPASTKASPPKPPPPSKSAPDDRLRAASEQGIAALVELKKQYPEDPQIPKQLALAYHEEKRTADALRAVAAAVNLDQEAVDDALVGVVVSATASRESSEDAFALLEGPLGERGIDALVELTTKGAPAARLRATKALAKPEVRAKASKATAILVDFRRAQTCRARKDLLDRVKSDGDARLLPTLKQMRSTSGCGLLNLGDCWGCLRSDDSLTETIDAVQARVDDAKK